MRYSIELRKSIFQQLFSFVTSIALWKILSQYKKLIERSTVISACTKVFIIIIELSCSHKIQERLYDEKSLLIEDVHSHWR
jgi:multisubunit Na+/H+ antiporter MnhG subunit